jgi:hypothetical protein
MKIEEDEKEPASAGKYVDPKTLQEDRGRRIVRECVPVLFIS